MKLSTHIKPISYLKSHAAEDVKSYEVYEETLALFKILALGQKQIELGHFRPAKDVFAELDDKEYTARK